ncbi:MAG: DUF1896 family protein [Flavobacteriia bacterium]|nr:DUF1896 family protein [Flavobacteriia bacterium]OJX36584.1 MAG: hypothetical protein BGO87_12340 [Flavobacteriia bacterium 40-80]
METLLKEQLWSYIAGNNPELMYDLQEEYQVSEYLEKKVSSVMKEAEDLLEQGLPAITVQEICMERMTGELRPSKFQYIKNILEEEFSVTYELLLKSGMLTLEVINIMQCCERIFQRLGFSEETADDRRLRYAVMGEISNYLE